MTLKTSPRSVCEAHLRDGIRYNRERGILARETSVAERMLASGDALEQFYGEIYPRLNHDSITWKHALQCALYVGTFWAAEDIAKRRAGRKELEQLNAEIALQARLLADLLDRRTQLYELSGFGAETHYAILDVIGEASEHNGHYQTCIKQRLEALQRFDLKYWPSLSDCLRVIGVNARHAEIRANNDLTEAATHSTRPSKADSVRALLSSIEDHRGDREGGIPSSFEFSNSALADLVNVLFALAPDDLVTEEYMKTQRHRFRTTPAARD